MGSCASTDSSQPRVIVQQVPVPPSNLQPRTVGSTSGAASAKNGGVQRPVNNENIPQNQNDQSGYEAETRGVKEQQREYEDQEEEGDKAIQMENNQDVKNETDNENTQENVETKLPVGIAEKDKEDKEIVEGDKDQIISNNNVQSNDNEVDNAADQSNNEEATVELEGDNKNNGKNEEYVGEPIEVEGGVGFFYYDKENEEDKDTKWLEAMQYGNDVIEKIIKGNVDIEIPSQVKLVRIFTSSTFTDTFIERNNLMERVYPKLKEYCQSVGYDFQVVDMRWGVRDEATEDHMTSELCMTEIRACQKLSTGPNFITFLGQKYGYRPFPPKIIQSEFEALSSAVEKQEDKDLLTKWFIRDDNLVPPMYILQPVKELIPNYNNRSVSNEERSKASGEWWTAFEAIQEILREASIKALKKEEDIAKYRISVTEDEIRRGILGVKDKEKHCCWFKRNITDIDEYLDKPKARNFIDKASNDLDVNALSLLNELKQQISEKLPEENIKQYDVKWCGESCINPKESEEHKAYVDQLCKDFYDTLVDMINKGIEEKKKLDLENSLVKEISLHTTTCQEKSRVFYGREDVLDAIMSHVRTSLANDKVGKKSEDEAATDKRILVVHGASGCGKTSIMAVAVKKIKEKYPDTAMIQRFLGTTSESSTVSKMLYSVCNQLCHIIGQNPNQVPETFKKMRDFFSEKLSDLKTKLVIILDSLDQLAPEDGALSMQWLPKEVSKNVSIIVSTLPGEEYKVLPALKIRLPENAFEEVPVMSQDTAGLILDAWLKDAHHTTTAAQKEIVMNAFKECPLPLYLKLSFDEAKRWKSYTPIDESVLKSTVKEAINGLFARLERFHGFHLVSHGLGYITAAKNGISDAEMDDILSIDDAVLNDVYQYWTPPVRRIPPLLWIRVKTDLGSYIVSRGADGVLVNNWYHRQFIETARERYLKPEIATKIHETMADYFLGKWSGGVQKPFTSKQGDSSEKDRLVPAHPNIFPTQGDQMNNVYNYRKLSELPRHLIKCGNLQALKDQVIFNFDFLSTKLAAFGLLSVVQDFDETLEAFANETEIQLLRDCLKMSGKGLIQEPNQLPAQLNARLSHLGGYDRISDLLEQSRSANVPCLYPSVSCFQRPGGSLVHSLVGHGMTIAWASVTKDGKMLLTVSHDYTMKVWDLEEGSETRSYDIQEGFGVARFYNNEKCVLLAGDNSTFVAMDLHTEEIIFQDDEIWGVSGTCMDLIADGKKVVHATAEKISVFDVDGRDIKPAWTYDEASVENYEGLNDKICGGGNYYGYTRGNSHEITIRKSDDQEFVTKLKVTYEMLNFIFDEDGKELFILGTNSSRAVQYKEVHLIVYNTSSWKITKDSKSKFDHVMVDVSDLHISKLATGRELIWTVMTQINFWNLETGDERVALKTGYNSSMYRQTVCTEGKYLAVFTLDMGQTAIQVYDLSLLEYNKDGDEGVSETEKLKDYLGKGEKDVFIVGDDPNKVISIPSYDKFFTIWDVEYQDRVRVVHADGLYFQVMHYINETHLAVWDYQTKYIYLINHADGRTDAHTTGKVCETLPSSYNNMWHYLGDYKCLACSENAKEINNWDLKNGKLIGKIKTEEAILVNSMLVSKDASTLLIAPKDHEAETQPLFCVDVSTGKQLSKIEEADKTVDLYPDNTALSKDGHYLYKAHYNEKCITVYDTRTGGKDKEMAYKPTADDNVHEDYSKESTVEGVCYLSNSDCIIVSVAMTDKSYSSFYKLICFDLKTDDVIAKSSGSISRNSKMTLSKNESRMICASQPQTGGSKSIDIWDVSKVKQGSIQLVGRFLPDTDVRFYYLTTDGKAACVGVAGTEELIFLRVCGEEKQKKRTENCVETKVAFVAVADA